MLRFFKQYYPIRNIFFIVGEGVFIYIAVLFASWVLINPESFTLGNLLSRKASLIAFVCMICLYFNDVYDLQITNSYFELGIRLFQALGASSIILAFVYFLFQEMVIGKGIFFITVFFSMILIVLWRFLYKMVLNHGLFDQNIIILGSDGLGKKITSEIIKREDCGYRVSFVIMENHENDLSSYHGLPVIYKEKFEGLFQMAQKMGIKKIILALKEKRGTFPTRELLNCRIDGIDILEGNSFYETLTGKLPVEQVNPGWLIFSDGFKKSFIKHLLKRFTDIFFSFIMLVIFLPVILTTAILIKIDSKGPVFFLQDRVGQKRKIYRIFKFRSMIVDAEKKSGPVWAQSNDDRITRFGKFIRKWRIDEIPQLLNVLKGDMSFAGPRPER
ncbi:MAG: capsular biosynthesis protein CpsE, partial [Desulfobacteraceae bacterium 4572_187]